MAPAGELSVQDKFDRAQALADVYVRRRRAAAWSAACRVSAAVCTRVACAYAREIVTVAGKLGALKPPHRGHIGVDEPASFPGGDEPSRIVKKAKNRTQLRFERRVHGCKTLQLSALATSTVASLGDRGELARDR